jgi:tetrapyrrole methylase family protein / MazG family protein
VVELCARLRAPGGCPWDREQTLESLRTYIIEEAYEVVEALGRADHTTLAGELGDLLFQIVFVADIARENGWFGIETVCSTVHEKMVRRHPHVFGSVEVAGASEVVQNWEAIKQQERARGGALAGVPQHLPALLKALRVTEKASAVGFDWQRVDDVLAKLDEEVGELKEELGRTQSPRSDPRVRAELGDVLFVIANIARQLGIDPEAALQETNAEFSRRFGFMEGRARELGRGLTEMTLTELDTLWEEAKNVATAV